MSWSFSRIRPHILVAGAFAMGQLGCVFLGTHATPASAQAARSGRGSGSSQAASTKAGSGQASPAFTGQGDGDAKRGRELFVKDACYQCHGYEGQGGSAGARLGPDPMPPEAMAAVIRKDNGMMPPFSAKLVSDQDIVDIVAFLKTVSKPTDVKNIPTFTK